MLDFFVMVFYIGLALAAGALHAARNRGVSAMTVLNPAFLPGGGGSSSFRAARQYRLQSGDPPSVRILARDAGAGDGSAEPHIAPQN
jgi:hypothetical protein